MKNEYSRSLGLSVICPWQKWHHLKNESCTICVRFHIKLLTFLGLTFSAQPKTDVEVDVVVLLANSKKKIKKKNNTEIKKKEPLRHISRKRFFGNLRPGKTQTSLLSYRD